MANSILSPKRPHSHASSGISSGRQYRTVMSATRHTSMAASRGLLMAGSAAASADCGAAGSTFSPSTAREAVVVVDARAAVSVSIDSDDWRESEVVETVDDSECRMGGGAKRTEGWCSSVALLLAMASVVAVLVRVVVVVVVLMVDGAVVAEGASVVVQTTFALDAVVAVAAAGGSGM